jgi:hypothetical protein
MSNGVRSLWFRNASPSQIEIVIEPTGAQLVIRPRCSVLIDYLEETEGPNEVIVESNRIKLYFNSTRAILTEEDGRKTVLWE